MNREPPKKNWNEKELKKEMLPTTLHTPITREELGRIKTAWAKSYNVQEHLVKLSFKSFPPDDPDHKTHVMLIILVRGGLLPDGKVDAKSVDWRKVYSLKIMPPQEIQEAAQKQRSLLAHTPLSTISLTRPAKPAESKGSARLRIDFKN